MTTGLSANITSPDGTFFNTTTPNTGDGVVYANFYGNLNGNATTASLATQITTTNTTANATHYLDFSDSSSTGNGSVQKTAGLSCNPSTNTITATTFSGSLSGTATNSTNSAITDDNTNATFYPVFVSNNTGNLPLKVDKTTNHLSYNPSTGNLSSSIFTCSANITNAINNVSVVATTLTLDLVL